MIYVFGKKEWIHCLARKLNFLRKSQIPVRMLSFMHSWLNPIHSGCFHTMSVRYKQTCKLIASITGVRILSMDDAMMELCFSYQDKQYPMFVAFDPNTGRLMGAEVKLTSCVDFIICIDYSTMMKFSYWFLLWYLPCFVYLKSNHIDIVVFKRYQLVDCPCPIQIEVNAAIKEDNLCMLVQNVFRQIRIHESMQK